MQEKNMGHICPIGRSWVKLLFTSSRFTAEACTTIKRYANVTRIFPAISWLSQLVMDVLFFSLQVVVMLPVSPTSNGQLLQILRKLLSFIQRPIELRHTMRVQVSIVNTCPCNDDS